MHGPKALAQGGQLHSRLSRLGRDNRQGRVASLEARPLARHLDGQMMVTVLDYQFPTYFIQSNVVVQD
jgi:hypothetical protein